MSFSKNSDSKKETIFETEQKLKLKAQVLKEKELEVEKEKLANGYKWIEINSKTRILTNKFNK